MIYIIIQSLIFSDKFYISYLHFYTSYPGNFFIDFSLVFLFLCVFIYKGKGNIEMDLSKDKHLQKTISDFIDHYGQSGLEQALQLYTDMQQEYICKTKTSISKIKIYDIYYLEIMGHHIDVHTEHGTFRKYGTLNNELKQLSAHGFIKCNQSCIVAINKIRTVLSNEIILSNHEHLYMSRHYAPNVLMAYSRNKK